MTDGHTSRWPKAVRWFLLWTLPKHEARAAQLLRQRGFQSYLPATIETHARLKSTYERPIFPRYLFARFAYSDRSRILMTPGLSEIVTFDGEPATLSDAEIKDVRKLEAELRSPRPRSKPGQVVSIQVGRITLSGKVAGHQQVMLRVLRAA